MTVHIVGLGQLPATQCVLDVRDALHFDQDIYLLAQFSTLCGIELKDAAIYNLEPLYDGCRSFSLGYLEVLKRNHVLDYSRRNVEYLKTRGVEAFHLPYGFHRSLYRVAPAVKDIDVLFVGSPNPRRVEFFAKFEKKLSFGWAQGVYGPDLDRLVARAKVHLNVHFRDPHPLEVVRLNYLMANGCTVVSEPGWDDELNSAYRDGLTFARLGDFVDVCRDALNHPGPTRAYECVERLAMDCSGAQSWLNQRMPADRHIASPSINQEWAATPVERRG